VTRCERGNQACTPACESILSSIRSPESRLSPTRRVSRVRFAGLAFFNFSVHSRPSTPSSYPSISSNSFCSLTLSRRLTDRSRHRATSSSSSAVRCHRRRRWFVVRRSSFVVRRSSFVVRRRPKSAETPATNSASKNDSHYIPIPETYTPHTFTTHLYLQLGN